MLRRSWRWIGLAIVPILALALALAAVLLASARPHPFSIHLVNRTGQRLSRVSLEYVGSHHDDPQGKAGNLPDVPLIELDRDGKLLPPPPLSKPKRIVSRAEVAAWKPNGEIVLPIPFHMFAPLDLAFVDHFGRRYASEVEVGFIGSFAQPKEDVEVEVTSLVKGQVCYKVRNRVHESAWLRIGTWVRRVKGFVGS